MTSAITGSESDRPTGKLIEFPISSQGHSVSEASSSLGSTYVGVTSPNLHRGAVTYLKRESIEDEFSRVLNEENRKYLNDAFSRLTYATDMEIDQIERSNNFDEWKDLLIIVSRKADRLTLHHRKILGSLIIAVNGCDIVDFNNNALKIFLEATNVLRQPRVSRQDSDRIISNLINNDINIMLPLSIENEQDAHSKDLDKMMKELIRESSK
ncbi:hypothetical protein KJ656_14785 [bacterium]|nr:hypothetical protein [bacterium]